MALSDEIVKLLEEFGESTKDDLQQSLRDKGVTFGGQDSKLSNSIKFDIIAQGNSVTFKLSMNDYSEFVDKGRGKGGVSKPGQESISKWISRKGLVGKFANDTLQARLQKQAKNKTDRKKKTLKKPSFEKSLKALTYLVSRKLKQKGYEGNNFYSEVIEDGRLETLKTKLSEILKESVQIEIINLAKI